MDTNFSEEDRKLLVEELSKKVTSMQDMIDFIEDENNSGLEIFGRLILFQQEMENDN